MKHTQSKFANNRKQKRKEERRIKKVRRQEHYIKKRSKPSPIDVKLDKKPKSVKRIKSNPKPFDPFGEILAKNHRDERKLSEEIKKSGRKQLLHENEKEDMVIRKLEKQLKLNKVKNATKSFAVDGLDYILDMCDASVAGEAAKLDQNFFDMNDGFEDDLLVAQNKRKTHKNQKRNDVDDEVVVSVGFDELHENDEDSYDDDSEKDHIQYATDKNNEESDDDDENSEEDHLQYATDENNDEIDDADDIGDDDENDSKKQQPSMDIETDVVSLQPKYIPPALRGKTTPSEQLTRLKTIMKGQLNRLTAANLISIGKFFDEMYNSGTYSRYEFNQTFAALVMDAVVLNASTSARTVTDYALIVALLYANTDSEIGANFLQTLVNKFDGLCAHAEIDDNKQLENSVHLLAQLYSLKIFQGELIHDVIKNIVRHLKFTEKSLESILIVLKTCGVVLRKDNPALLKETIIFLQKNVQQAQNNGNGTRLRFMMDVLMAIKNNNLNKIPQYDHDASLRSLKLLRGALRKGVTVTQLNISLDDLLNADKRGRWWIVGSAWSDRNEYKNETSENKPAAMQYGAKILAAARKQHMNTDTRKSIFCILASAEDCDDAFEKLLHLNLKGLQLREITNVILHCCLQERKFNIFYAVLAEKFCDLDRKYKISLQCSLWDKFKVLNDLSDSKISNLSKFLVALLLNAALPFSIFKVIELNEMNVQTARLLRQTIIGVFLHDDVDERERVWRTVSNNKTFIQGISMFIYQHFLRDDKSNAQKFVAQANVARDILTAMEKRANKREIKG